MLLDSNIIIYSALEEHEDLREFIEGISPSASEISRIEVLGFHKLSPDAGDFFTALFETFDMFPISSEVVAKAVELRQAKKIALGDSIVAATAILQNRTLVTANVKDFHGIPDLKIFNPLDL
ncbi:MAG TPA: type II toxin-antitoxin system VapC family toxin [Pyrinomonadaceae bacterium]|nr:type II toxin-antitoxin system VapC family toxin [Pyrinomonadaceae bacterium]